MTPVQWAIVIVVLVLAAFVARGMYLLGRGTDAEHQARAASTGNAVTGTGWMVLDMVRTSSHPMLRWIDEKIGRQSPTRIEYLHQRCGSTNVEKRGASWYCYHCDTQTTDVREIEVGEIDATH